VSRRTTLLAFIAAAVLGLVALLLAAGSDRRHTAFSADARISSQVAFATTGTSICQGELHAEFAFSAIRAWILTAGPTAMTLVVTPRNGALALGALRSTRNLVGSHTIALNRTVSAGSRVVVCVHNEGPGNIGMLGGLAPASEGPLRVAGRVVAPGDGLALMFLRPHPASLLSMLPTVFSRAALFKFSWLGAWTFWLLAVAVLAAFVVAGFAVTQATREDTDSARTTTPQ
jgi:hypothetical protein